MTPSPPRTAPTRRLTEVGLLVDARARHLQETLATSATTALMATLRHAVALEPGSVPAVWEITVAGAPGTPQGDGPTAAERAMHAALTLFATHQQSRSEPMHEAGAGLGSAVRRLEGALGMTPAGGQRTAVRRRFDATATAATWEELAHHLRGLVTQLRGSRVPLDYGALADDLLQWQRPDGPAAVRLRWARQYYRTTDTPGAPTVAGPTPESPEGEQA